MGYLIFVLLVSTTDPSDWKVAIEKRHVFANYQSCVEFIATSVSIAIQKEEWNSPDMKASWGCITADELRELGLMGAGDVL